MTTGATILVTGYAQAPKGTPMYEIHKWAGIVLEIDVPTQRIVDADSTMVSELSRGFFKRLLVGYDLSQGIEPLVELMIARLQTNSREAQIVALRAAVQRFNEFLRKLDQPATT